MSSGYWPRWVLDTNILLDYFSNSQEIYYFYYYSYPVTFIGRSCLCFILSALLTQHSSLSLGCFGDQEGKLLTQYSSLSLGCLGDQQGKLLTQHSSLSLGCLVDQEGKLLTQHLLTRRENCRNSTRSICEQMAQCVLRYIEGHFLLFEADNYWRSRFPN